MDAVLSERITEKWKYFSLEGGIFEHYEGDFWKNWAAPIRPPSKFFCSISLLVEDKKGPTEKSQFANPMAKFP